MRLAARALAAASLALVSACASRPVERPAPGPTPTPAPAPVPAPVPPPPRTALEAGVTLVEPPASIPEAVASRALGAFRASCPVLAGATDKSGLASREDWAVACAEAAALQPGQGAAFFRDRFDWVRVGDGRAFATGYYEPEIAASRIRQPGFDVPIYAMPSDLTRCTYVDGRTGRGRIDEAGTCVPYFTRAEIEDGTLDGKAPVIAWAADRVELFFLQIQGSGRLRMPDGSVIRIGYAEQNGREYVAVGRLLRERGLLPSGGADMAAIKQWLRASPELGNALMRENLSYVFFRELTGPGPLGALGVPVTPRASVAADPAFVPLGAPVWLVLDRPEASGLWVAQDTGGAIKGANRFDTFWGAGPDAVAIAGGMSASGQAVILIPKGSAARALAKP